MRVLMITVLLAGMALLCAGCGSGSGSPGATGTVAGFIYIDGGGAQLLVSAATRADLQPAVGAVIAVRGISALSTVTDATGYFSLEGVPVGPQVLYVSADGLARVALQVPVSEGLYTISPLNLLRQAEYKWTVLVYMAADNDLEGAGIDDFNEMEEVGSTDEVKVLVQFDRHPGYDTSNGNWTGARRYEVLQDNDPNIINSLLLETMGNVDMGNPATLRDFITWGQTYAPAERYLLVLWNHGTGWSATDRGVAESRAICYDYSSGSAIRVTELPGALTGVDPIDIIATDACLMAMTEVAYEIRGQADYLVGSEEESAWKGYAYQRVLGMLTSSQGLAMSPATFAAFMAQDAFLEWSPFDYTATSCAIDLARLPAVAQAVNGLAARLRQVGNQHKTDVIRAQADAQKFSPRSITQRADLYHYAALLDTYVADGTTRTRAREVKTAVGQAVIANFRAGGRPNAYGLSIYLPTAQEFARARTQYGNYYPQLAFARDTQWDEWLAEQPSAP